MWKVAMKCEKNRTHKKYLVIHFHARGREEIEERNAKMGSLGCKS